MGQTRMRRMLLGLMAGLLLAAGIGWADTLVTSEGKVYQGRLISQRDGKVVFEVHMYGSKFNKTFQESDVTVTKGDAPGKAAAAEKADGDDEPVRPEAPAVRKYDGPTYYRVPLTGMVGKTFTAGLLEASLADALRRMPTVVILEVDSPGGVISEVTKIGAVLQKYSPRLRLIVFAKDAISAAAITSMSVKEIYVKPLGRFGAATAWQVGENGMPTAIGEKFQSVWRATARSMAETGGHEPMLAEAMIDARVELHMVEEDGTKSIRHGQGPKMITESGRLLTMTATEAVDVGLAKAKIATLDELREALGFESWTECEGLGVPLADWQAKRLKKAEKAFKDEVDAFRENLDSAIANDPSKSDYVVYQGGQFTPASKKKWRRLAGVCTRFLTKAEKNLEAAAALAEEYPGLLSDPDMLRTEKDKLSSLRKRVYAEMNRQGLGR